MSYLERLEAYKEEMLQMLRELIAIPSVEGEAEEGAPFGREVQRAYEYMLERGREEGFSIFDADHYGGHLAFGTGPGSMGILVHLDVVPAGSGWEFPPFEGVITEEGRLYGRGAQDDKGPAAAAFYAMKALKDEGVVPGREVRLILGLDEETHWKGMKYYLDRAGAPDFSVTPDGDFPVIHGEKGILIFEIAGKFSRGRKDGLALRSIEGGNAANMAADWAKALVSHPEGASFYAGIKEKLAAYKQRTGRQLAARGRGKSLEIEAQGISAHGATPEKGLNAISVLMEFLGELEFVNEDHKDFVAFYNRHLGFCLDGSALGCGLEDGPSGKLVLNVGKIQMDEESGLITVNIRYPISSSEEEVYAAMTPVLNRYNYGIVKLDHKAPIFIPEDAPLVTTLMEVYRKHSGDLETRPQIIGGGTYARAVPNAVAFGVTFPGEPEVQHQKNEYISIDSLMKAARI
ncbi:MAG: dipeptidase PepV, partial [Bacillota bacterium]|nr:dipeptidase PepV [Bacillota bacterium]